MPDMAKAASGIFCRSCGYDLRSLSENRCPECGREFDPGEKRTYDLKPRRSALTRWIWRIGILSLLTLIAAGCLITWTWRGWEDDQQVYLRLKKYGIVRKELAPMPVVEHLLPQRWQYLRTRVWSVCVDSKSMTDQDWQAVQQLSHVRDGRFGRIPSSDAAIRCIDSLKDLTLLNIGGENINDQKLAQFIQSMPKLETLSLSCNNITDAGIAAIAKSKSLRRLTLYNCDISANGLMSLTELPSLRELFLGKTLGLSDEDINHFKAARPDVKVRKLTD